MKTTMKLWRIEWNFLFILRKDWEVMKVYVKAVDIDYRDGWWLRVEGDDIEAYELDEIRPDPFSKVANILKGKRFKVGIYEFEVIGDAAYTRADYVGGMIV